MAHLEVKRRSRSLWWLWVIIVILIAAAAVYYFEVYKPANTAMIMPLGRSFFAGTAIWQVDYLPFI